MLKVCHLYPDLLNLYGDRGNVIALTRRCRWRGIPVSVKKVNLGDDVNFEEYDILFIGGGSDKEQALVVAELHRQIKGLGEAIEDGLVVLAICGGFQMLGKHYIMPDGRKIPGLGLLDYYTEAGEQRLIGNVVIEVKIKDKTIKVAGFENHAGRTYLGKIEPLGRVLAGNGNNSEDSYEGARYKNVLCSYLHGPLLPKNPSITDFMITKALQRRGEGAALAPLDDYFEKVANESILNRLLG